MTSVKVGSISAVLSCSVFPEQRLVIEPTVTVATSDLKLRGIEIQNPWLMYIVLFVNQGKNAKKKKKN